MGDIAVGSGARASRTLRLSRGQCEGDHGQPGDAPGHQDGLDWLYEKLQADGSDNTTAVIYYSGHGWQDTASSPAAYYLIPYDMQAGRYKSRALRANDFAEAIAELRPRRLLLILDCCHAAGIEAKDLDADADIYQESAIPPHILMAGEKAVDVTAATAKDIAALAQGAGRAVLSSCQTEKSYIRRDRKMSVFTYHLIEALTGHAQPQDGATEVLVSDVMSHVTRTVPESARREAAATQTPDFQISGNLPVSLILRQGLSKGEPAPIPSPTRRRQGRATSSSQGRPSMGRRQTSPAACRATFTRQHRADRRPHHQHRRRRLHRRQRPYRRRLRRPRPNRQLRRVRRRVGAHLRAAVAGRATSARRQTPRSHTGGARAQSRSREGRLRRRQADGPPAGTNSSPSSPTR
ncbi:MAG: caspase family protein [Caldilineaceae bacterium]